MKSSGARACLIADARTKTKKGTNGKKLRGYQKDVKFVEVGD
jgi:hypothetical protein